MPRHNKIPDIFCRVIHRSGAWLKSPAVSPAGVVDIDSTDTSRMTTTMVLREASAWPVQRALAIAAMFPDAIVDRVDVALGTTDHRPGGPCSCGCALTP